MASRTIPYVTPEEYLEIERNTDGKNEYINGEIFPVEGGTRAHSRITTNTILAVGKRLAGGVCEVYDSSLNVCIDRSSLYVHPDVSVICGKPEYASSGKDTISNPRLVVEVMSPTTANYDLGWKARRYWKIASLRNLLLIEQEEVWIEHWFRAEGGKWESLVLESLSDILCVESLSIEIPVSEIYRGVEFPEPAA